MALYRRTFVAVIIGAVLLTGSLACASATEEFQISNEYKIKAAFIYKFINFVEWQRGDLGTKSICVFGDNPFGDALEQIVAVHDPSFSNTRVVKTRSMADLKSCSIVFISRSEESSMLDVLGMLQQSAALTISDVRNFARAGGIIEFVLEGDRIRFIINQEQAKDEGLKISSQLLSLAKNFVRGQ